MDFMAHSFPNQIKTKEVYIWHKLLTKFALACWLRVPSPEFIESFFCTCLSQSLPCPFIQKKTKVTVLTVLNSLTENNRKWKIIIIIIIHKKKQSSSRSLMLLPTQLPLGLTWLTCGQSVSTSLWSPYHLLPFSSSICLQEWRDSVTSFKPLDSVRSCPHSWIWWFYLVLVSNYSCASLCVTYGIWLMGLCKVTESIWNIKNFLI